MSDSRNVRFMPSNLYVYVHYDADVLPRRLARAIKQDEGRWSDVEYFTRYVVGHLIQPYENSLVGAGMGVGPGTLADYPDLIVDTDLQTVDGVSYAQFVLDNTLE